MNDIKLTRIQQIFNHCGAALWSETCGTEMEVDQNASERFRWFRVSWKLGRIGINLRFNPVVTILSAAIIWSFVIGCSVEADAAFKEMSLWTKWITHTCTWMYIGTQDVWAVFIIVLYFSKYGKMKLGKPDDKPEFSDATYFTMLFAAGIGVGLFYFGVGMYRFLKFINLSNKRKVVKLWRRFLVAFLGEIRRPLLSRENLKYTFFK